MVLVSSDGSTNEQVIDMLRDRAERLHTEIECAFEEIYTADHTVTAYMDRSKLDKLFPKCRAILNEPPRSLPRTRVSVDTYFQHFGMLNQLVTLAGQIRHDLLYLSNHKYIAHQVAMMYQCLSNAGDPVRGLKKKVESRFSELKDATTPDDSGHPVRLGFSLAHWLEKVLDEVIAVVDALPRVYKDPLVRPTKFMLLQASET